MNGFKKNMNGHSNDMSNKSECKDHCKDTQKDMNKKGNHTPHNNNQSEKMSHSKTEHTSTYFNHAQNSQPQHASDLKKCDDCTCREDGKCQCDCNEDDDCKPCN
jgi:hypothetical protein